MKCIQLFWALFFFRILHLKKKRCIFWQRKSYIGISLFLGNCYLYVLQVYIKWRIKKRDISIGLISLFSISYKRKLQLRRKHDIASDFWFNRYKLSPLTTRWPFCSAQMSLHMIQNKEWRHYQQNDTQSQGCHGGQTVEGMRVIQDRIVDKIHVIISRDFRILNKPHAALHQSEERMPLHLT